MMEAVDIVAAIERVLEGRELDYQKERRRHALLQAAAVIQVAETFGAACIRDAVDPLDRHKAAIGLAELLLAEIESREF